jgi:hypothetical protein
VVFVEGRLMSRRKFGKIPLTDMLKL